MVRSRAARIPLVGLALVAVGCGATTANDVGGVVAPIKTTAFPKPADRSLEALASPYRAGPRLAPVVAVLRPGRIRLAFRLYDRSRRQIGGAPAVVYIARGLDQRARGPYLARFRPLAHGRARHNKEPATTHRRRQWIYVSHLAIRRPGTYVLVALMRLDNRLIRTAATTVTVTSTRHR